MESIVKTFQNYPELAIFLALALGYWFGNIKFGTFSFGTVTGVLLAGILVGQFHIEISPNVKQVFFLMFLFAIGYKVGPQFFRGLKKDGLQLMIYTVFLCVVGLVTAWVVAKFLNLDPGLSAGLISGSLTESAVIGTASDAINQLHIPEAEKQRLIAHIPVADAVTYVFGTAGVVWFLSSIAPKLLGIDLKEAAKELETKLGVDAVSELGVFTAAQKFGARAYRVEEEWLYGKTVAEIEARFKDRMLYVGRIRQHDRIIEAAPDTVISRGQILAVFANNEVFAGGDLAIGPEVIDKELLDFPVEILDVVITKRGLAGKTLDDLRAEKGYRGIGLKRYTRGGQEIPFSLNMAVERGDVLQLVGPKQSVEEAAQFLGYADRQTNKTDMVFVGIAIVLGGLLGTLYIMAGNMKLSLTTSLGALIGGLVFGWLRSVHPTFGRIPEPAQWLMESVGLSVFVACVGIHAGPTFIDALKQSGIGIFLGGIVVTLMPHVLGLFFGKYVLKLDPVILLGANAGSLTCTAGLAAVQEKAGSQIPVMGYTMTYAVGNILLALWGPIIVMLKS